MAVEASRLPPISFGQSSHCNLQLHHLSLSRVLIIHGYERLQCLSDSQHLSAYCSAVTVLATCHHINIQGATGPSQQGIREVQERRYKGRSP